MGILLLNIKIYLFILYNCFLSRKNVLVT